MSYLDDIEEDKRLIANALCEVLGLADDESKVFHVNDALRMLAQEVERHTRHAAMSKACGAVNDITNMKKGAAA